MAWLPVPTMDDWVGRHRPIRASRRAMLGAAVVGAVAALVAERLPRWLGLRANTPAVPAGGIRALGPISQVPVGGGRIFRTYKVVVTQPAAGTFKAFNAECTHAGCLVDSVLNGKINCPCHPGVFRIDDGSVVSGPPPRPLAPAMVSIQGDQLYLHV